MHVKSDKTTIQDKVTVKAQVPVCVVLYIYIFLELQ